MNTYIARVLASLVKKRPRVEWTWVYYLDRNGWMEWKDFPSNLEAVLSMPKAARALGTKVRVLPQPGQAPITVSELPGAVKLQPRKESGGLRENENCFECEPPRPVSGLPWYERRAA